MSYVNGIGVAQQFPETVEVAPSSYAPRTAKAETSPGSAQSILGSAMPADGAQLSSAASLVVQALSESDVRGDKVSALQQSIVAGTYDVPASDVAAKVLRALLR